MKIPFLLIAVLTFSLTVMAQTNAAAPPVVDKIDSWLNAAQSILTAASSILAIILGIVAKLKAKQASVIGPLIKSIEAFGSFALKAQIKARATEAGVEKTLNKLVDKNTASTSEAEPPIANPPKPTNI